MTARFPYQQMHGRVRTARGPAKGSACVDCGADALDWSYSGDCSEEIQAMSNSGRVMPCCPHPDHYEPRCRACHRQHDGRYGEGSPAAKLTEDQVVEIRARYGGGDVLQNDLAAEYGVSVHNIWAVISGKTWTHIPLGPKPPHRRGERSAIAKLSDAQVQEIRDVYAAGGVSQRKLAAQYEVHNSVVSRIVTGHSRPA